MPDSQKSLGIRVETSADNAALKGVAQDLDKVASGTKKGAEANAEGAKEAGFFSLRLGELRKLTRELSEQFPLLGQAVRFALNPIAASFSAAIAIFSAAKEKLDEWNRELDEQAAKNAEHFSNLRARIEEAERAVKYSTNSILSSLKSIADAEQTVTDKINEQIDAIHRKEEAALAVQDAQAARSMAEVEAQRKTGQLTDVEAAVQSANIRIQAEQRQNAAKAAAETADLRQHEAAMDAAAMEQRNLQKIVDAGKGGEVMRQARIKNLPDIIDHYQKNSDDLDRQIAAQGEKLGAAYRAETEVTQGSSPRDKKFYHDTYVAPEEEKYAALELQRKQEDAARRQSADELARLQKEQAAYEQAGVELDKVKEHVHQLVEEFKKVYSDAATNRATRNTVADLHAQTEVTSTAGQIGGDLLKAAQDSHLTLEQHQAAVAALTNFMRAFGLQVGQLTGVQQETISTLAKNQAAIEQLLRETRQNSARADAVNLNTPGN